MSGRFFIQDPDGPDTFPFVVRKATFHVDPEEQVDSKPLHIPCRCTKTASGTIKSEPASRLRLQDCVRQTYPSPEDLEGRSELTVAEVLA